MFPSPREQHCHKLTRAEFCMGHQDSRGDRIFSAFHLKKTYQFCSVHSEYFSFTALAAWAARNLLWHSCTLTVKWTERQDTFSTVHQHMIRNLICINSQLVQTCSIIHLMFSKDNILNKLYNGVVNQTSVIWLPVIKPMNGYHASQPMLEICQPPHVTTATVWWLKQQSNATISCQCPIIIFNKNMTKNKYFLANDDVKKLPFYHIQPL